MSEADFCVPSTTCSSLIPSLLRAASYMCVSQWLHDCACVCMGERTHMRGCEPRHVAYVRAHAWEAWTSSFKRLSSASSAASESRLSRDNSDAASPAIPIEHVIDHQSIPAPIHRSATAPPAEPRSESRKSVVSFQCDIAEFIASTCVL